MGRVMFRKILAATKRRYFMKTIDYVPPELALDEMQRFYPVRYTFKHKPIPMSAVRESSKSTQDFLRDVYKFETRPRPADDKTTWRDVGRERAECFIAIRTVLQGYSFNGLMQSMKASMWAETLGGEIALCLNVLVPDSYQAGRLTGITFTTRQRIDIFVTEMSNDKQRFESLVHSCIRSLIKTAMLHEMDESVCYDGVLVRDPHGPNARPLSEDP
jgi:hypothetical protein